MRFRPCIDIHNGRVKQIVGATLSDHDGAVRENFVASRDASFFADYFGSYGLSGGHIILLNPSGSPQYEATYAQALSALRAAPGLWQAGGGVTPENAASFLDAGATHVIVTSYVFRDGRIDMQRLERMAKETGREHLVLDLSCKKKDSRYAVVTDRWQHVTGVTVQEETLDKLAAYCDEFLIHAADAEGKREGIELPLVTLLGAWGKCPVTYAGGIRDTADIEIIREAGRGAVDFTVGSALEIYGGTLRTEEILSLCDRAE